MIISFTLASALMLGCQRSQMTQPVPKKDSIYDFTMKNIDGKEVSLKEFKGKVLVVVNVASKCGLTPQYEGLQATYKKYKDKGVEILGFPANNFMGQEPGSEADIKTFCSTKYNVTFPMFSKISVKGDDINPLYAWLVGTSGRKDDVEWNFAKFIIGKDGKVFKRLGPQEKPTDKAFIDALEAALKA